MNVLHAIWLSSIAGGAAFFSAGFLLKGAFTPRRERLESAGANLAGEAEARARVLLERASRGEAELAELRAHLQRRDAQLEEAKAQLATANTRVAESQRQFEHAKPKLDVAERTRREAIQRAERVEAAFDDATTELTRLAVVNAKLGETEAQLSAAKTKLSETEAQLSAAKSKVSETEAQLSAAKTRLREVEARLAARDSQDGEIERLRADIARLHGEIKELERERVGTPTMDLPTFQRKSAELSLKSQALDQRTLEFNRQADENRELKAKVSQLETTRLANEDLSRRVRELEAELFAKQGTRIPTLAPEPLLELTTAGRSERVQQTLDGFVRENPGYKVAVLSDVRGLLIAASGDLTHQNEVAAAASLTTYTTERMQTLLPMSKLVRFEWVDDNHVALRASWLQAGDDALLLATLRVDVRSADAKLDQVGTTLSRLMASSAESNG